MSITRLAAVASSRLATARIVYMMFRTNEISAWVSRRTIGGVLTFMCRLIRYTLIAGLALQSSIFLISYRGCTEAVRLSS